MGTAAYNEEWWTALVVPFLISVIVFFLRSVLTSARSSTALGYYIVETSNESISLITTSTVTIWNEGKSVLHPEDFARLRPLSLVLPDATLIWNKVTKTNQPANAVRAAPRDERGLVQIEFDYLAPGEGFEWQGEHDAPPGALRVEGWLKQAKRSPHRYHPKSRQFRLGTIAVLAGALLDTTNTLWTVVAAEGLSSWWFLGFLPGPLCIIVATGFILADLYADAKNPGPQLLREWQKVSAKLPPSKHR